MRRSITLIIILFCIACNTSKQKDESNKPYDSAAKDESSKPSHTVAKDEWKSFNRASAFEVLGHKKNNDYPSSKADTAMCKNWALNSQNIEQIIKDSEPISGPDWHHLFDHLPCSITGQLKQENRTFEFQINGGSWLTIKNNDSTTYFGYFKLNGDKLFVSQPMNVNEEEEND